jgi:hypothetical protein
MPALPNPTIFAARDDFSRRSPLQVLICCRVVRSEVRMASEQTLTGLTQRLIAES